MLSKTISLLPCEFCGFNRFKVYVPFAIFNVEVCGEEDELEWDWPLIVSEEDYCETVCLHCNAKQEVSIEALGLITESNSENLDE